MSARVDEIADRIYRISTFEAGGPPGGITFNQFLVDAEEPVLIHTGMRHQFAGVLRAASSVLDGRRLRWITSNHASRPDEFGALAEWFAVAPHAQAAHGLTGCFVNLPDVSDRPLRPLEDEEVLDLGGRRLRWMSTPHVPGPWEAGILLEEVTGTLFCGDLFAQEAGAGPVTDGDIVGPAIELDELMHATAVTPATGPTLHRLAALRPTTLAPMHAPSFVGDTGAALDELGTWFAARLEDATVPR